MSGISKVSSIDADKEKLFQKRRAKLAKWKQKKADFDSKKVSSEQVSGLKEEGTNTDTAEAKLLARQSKLKEWKKKKRERDEVRLKEVEPTKQQQRVTKSKNSKKRRFAFEDSDDENDHEALKLYIPDATAADDNSTTHEVYETVPKDTVDPLDNFMNNLEVVDKSKVAPSSMTGTLMDDMDYLDEIDFIVTESDPNDSSLQYKKIAKIKANKVVQDIKYNEHDLEPFQKQFYTESEEIRSMSTEDVNELRLNLGNIHIKGKDCPRPVTRWSQLGLSSDIMNLITKIFKYEAPTPIQCQAVPAIMSGRDVIGISKTGSGKTISYVLPLIRQIKAQRPLSKFETGPLGLIIAPTRELALQINEEVQKFTAYDSEIRSICCTGGSELKKQINDLKRGVEIVVATPGRFIDLLTLNSGKLLNTKRITFTILDEADRLFDMGFEPQVTQIMKTVRPDKQCVLFSATFPNKLQTFVKRVLINPLTVTINSKTMINENVKQQFEICSNDNEKFFQLINILDDFTSNTTHSINENDVKSQFEEVVEDRKIIIFVSSQQICDFLSNKLENYYQDVFSIHAGKPYQERVFNLEKFKNTKNSVLLCTEVLSRGLNVPEVSLVVIYNAVKTFAQYVHTTGRTARGLKNGSAITLLLPDEIASAYIVKKAIRDKELDNHTPQQISTLNEMVSKFEAGLKSGKFSISKGLGGKGLDNLASQREKATQKELNEYERHSKSKNTDTEQIEQPSTEIPTEDIVVPKLQYDIIRDTDSDGSTTYSAHVYINDLPKLIRWEVSKNDTLSSVRRETGCSITSRGQYYLDGSGPKATKDPQKLFLLIESKEEKDIILTIDLLEEKVKKGLRKVEIQTLKSNKY